MTKYSLRGFIKKTIEEHSGGIKFTELLAIVLCAWYEKEINYSGEDLTPEAILAAAKKDFYILRYNYYIGRIRREKIFICQRER